MIETLQSLRFVFALTVMLAHFTYAGIEGHSTGVGPMFFMLMTGLVMSRNYGKKVLEGTFNFKHFFLRRIFKFYPLHLLCLLFVIVVRRATLTADDYLALIPNVFLLQSWIPIESFYFSGNEVSWYLSDLLFFLLLFPIFYRVIGKMSGQRLLCLAAVLLGVYVTYVTFIRADDLNYWLYIFPPVRMFDFVWGMMLWRCYELHPSWGRFRHPTWMEMLLAAGVLLTIVTYPLHERWHVALIHWIVMVPLVLVFMQGDTNGGWMSWFLKTRTMFWLGGLTLDTYLLHKLIFGILLHNADKYNVQLPYLLMLLICLGVVVLASYLAHTYFVTPMNKKLQLLLKKN